MTNTRRSVEFRQDTAWNVVNNTFIFISLIVNLHSIFTCKKLIISYQKISLVYVEY